jgi:hemerythrin-like domain-containing protein
MTERRALPRRVVPPASPTLESLDATHRDILAMLAQLDELLDHLERAGSDSVAQASATAICGFFASTARQHHVDEERLVFPGLLRSGDLELVQHVQRLQQDHGWLEEDWIELAPNLQAVAQGQNLYDIDTLRQGVTVFTDLYHDHIRLEDSLVYPAARRASKGQ